MRADYSVWLLHADGATFKKALDTCISLEWNLAVNGIGSFSVRMPHGFDMAQIVNDQRVAIWRQPTGAAAYREFYGLIRRLDTQNVLTDYSLRGYDFNYVLAGHWVCYATGSSQSDKTGYQDDLMKAVVRDNIGANVAGPDTGRQISSTYWSTEADLALGATSTTRNFYAKNVYDVCVNLALESRQAGTDLYFDVVPIDDVKVEFRVYKNQRGSDRTLTGQVYVFSPDFGNVEQPTIVFDATDEANFIYTIGNHPKDATNAKTSSDTTRNTASIWAWREKVVDGRSVITATARQALSDAALKAGRVKKVFAGTILSTDTQRYGVDWNLGDKINVSYDGQQYTAMVRTIHGSVDENGSERIEGGLEVF